MKIILKHVLRNISEKKGRSLLIIVSLVIASVVFILNLTIPNQIVEANKNKTRLLVGDADILVTSFNKFNINDLKLNNEEIKAVGINQLYFIHKDKTVALYGTDLLDANKLKLVEEANLLDNEIIISDKTADKFNYQVNDIMTININNQNYKLKIVKILESKGLLYFKTYSGIVNNNTFNKINNTIDNNYSMYFIDVLNNENIDNFEKDIRNNNKNYMVEKLVDEEAIKDDNSYVTMILIIVFVMATIMIFFVVNTLNKMIVMERIPVIATFRSIGATKKKMNLILILENATYGLIGGIIGSLISLLINNFCVKLLLGGTELNTTVPIKNLIFGIIFSVILEVLMSVASIIKASKYSIKQLMFDNQSSRYELSKKESIISITLVVISILLNIFVDDSNIIIDLLSMILFWVGISYCIPVIMLIISKIICMFAKKTSNGSLIIASKNLGYNKMIISSSRLVVISISIMLVIFNVSKTFDKMLNSFSYQFSGYDIFIRDTTKEYTTYDKLINLDEIKQVDSVFMSSYETTYNNGKKFNSNPLILGMKDSRADIYEYNYKIKDLKDDEILIDSVYATSNNLKIGDKVKLEIKDINFKKEFKIVGTVNSFYYSVQREIIVMNEDYFIKNISKVPFQIVITATNKEDLKTVISKIEYELKDPDVTIMTVDEFVNSQRQNIHTIMYLFYIIIGLAVVLSFVGIVNNQIISFMERTKELAVLNSVCMSKYQLKKMLVIENITSNITACLVGFIVSIMSVKIINSVLNGIKLYINVKFDIQIAVLFITAMLLILLFTIVIPLKRLKKINVVEAIKYE